jgi:hypothetical protein
MPDHHRSQFPRATVTGPAGGSPTEPGRRGVATERSQTPFRSGRFRRGAVRALLVLLTGMLLTSCSWVQGLFGSDQPDKGVPVSVFDVSVGDCFIAPGEVKAELSDLQRVPCAVPHQQEAYAILPYKAADDSDVYPGNATLDTFAKGACAQAFTSYIGINYPDSSLWMTYLLPSARSWQQGDDRSVLCFVTTTGQALTKSVKGSKL